jgi:hypothetical protein
MRDCSSQVIFAPARALLAVFQIIFLTVIFALICLELYSRNLKGKEGVTLKIFIKH